MRHHSLFCAASTVPFARLQLPYTPYPTPNSQLSGSRVSSLRLREPGSCTRYISPFSTFPTLPTIASACNAFKVPFHETRLPPPLQRQTFFHNKMGTRETQRRRRWPSLQEKRSNDTCLNNHRCLSKVANATESKATALKSSKTQNRRCMRALAPPEHTTSKKVTMLAAVLRVVVLP